MDSAIALLAVASGLYRLLAQRMRGYSDSLAVRQPEGTLKISSEDLAFTLWCLIQRGLVRNDDKSSLYITVEGMDYVEQNLPSPDTVAAFLKSAS